MQHSLAYIAAAYVVFRVIVDVLEPWGMPPWTVQALQIVLLVGLVATIGWTLLPRRR